MLVDYATRKVIDRVLGGYDIRVIANGSAPVGYGFVSGPQVATATVESWVARRWIQGRSPDRRSFVPTESGKLALAGLLRSVQTE